MARRPRIDFPGAFHHVMNRGASHQATYENSLDKELFLTLLARASSRFGIEVIAFALMSNHYHLFVCSVDGQLSAAMQYIGRAYTQEFNSHHQRDGALFRGRFHSLLVDDATYFARVARYVELNPVSAAVCSLPELGTHRWSSFRYSAGLAHPPAWLATRRLWDHFGSAEGYRAFIESGLVDPQWQPLYEQERSIGNVLGSRSFVEQLARRRPEIAAQLMSNVVESHRRV